MIQGNTKLVELHKLQSGYESFDYYYKTIKPQFAICSNINPFSNMPSRDNGNFRTLIVIGESIRGDNTKGELMGIDITKEMYKWWDNKCDMSGGHYEEHRIHPRDFKSLNKIASIHEIENIYNENNQDLLFALNETIKNTIKSKTYLEAKEIIDKREQNTLQINNKLKAHKKQPKSQGLGR